MFLNFCKKGSAVIASIFLGLACFGQKRPIRLDDLNNFPNVSREYISNNGKYMVFNRTNWPLGSRKLIVQSVDKSWSKEFETQSAGFFVNNNKQFLYKSNDSLIVLTLGTDEIEIFSGVALYKVPTSGPREWLAFKEKKDSRLVLVNLKTHRVIKYTQTKSFLFDNKGRKLAFIEARQSDASSLSVKLVSFPDTTVNTIWSSTDSLTISNCVFDNQGVKFAFTVTRYNNEKKANSIWLLKSDAIKSEMIVDDGTGIDSGLMVYPASFVFSNNGSKIFFLLQESKEKKIINGIDVWSYFDAELQSKQLTDVKFTSARSYKAVVDLNSKRILQLETGNAKIVTDPIMKLMNNGSGSFPYDLRNDDVVILEENCGTNEWYWNRTNQSSVFIVDLTTGSKKTV
jgi:hypothetical protein